GIGLTPHRPAGQGVAKFVREHDREKRQIFGDVPANRTVFPPAALDRPNGHKEPTEVEIDGDPEEGEEPDAAVDWARSHRNIIGANASGRDGGWGHVLA